MKKILKQIASFYSRQNFVVIMVIRIVLFLFLACILFMIGLMIGYSVLGDGSNPFEIFSPNIWQRIIDFIG